MRGLSVSQNKNIHHSPHHSMKVFEPDMSRFLYRQDCRCIKLGSHETDTADSRRSRSVRITGGGTSTCTRGRRWDGDIHMV